MTARWRQALRAENRGELPLDNLVARGYDRSGEPGGLVGLSWVCHDQTAAPRIEASVWRPTRDFEATVARTEGREWAGPLAGMAAIVLLILTVLLAAHKQRERDYAIELVLEGLETVPIAAVQRQRRRLLSDRTRQGLAGNLEELIRQAARRSRLHVRVTPLPFQPMVPTVLKAASRK